MRGIKEYPRNGEANSPIENGGEMHLACVVLLDTSTSMHGTEKQLLNGLQDMYDALDPLAKGRVEICIIGFDDQARILKPFSPAYDDEIPRFNCEGMTAMHAAVDYGIGELDARKEQYRANHTSYYRSWMFMLTDGEPNDSDNGAFEKLVQYQEDGHCTFFPVAIGEHADTSLLKSLQVDGIVLKATKENFQNSFVWLSNSLSKVSDSDPGSKVPLSDPVEYQLEVVS